MARTVTISDDVAKLLEKRRQQDGYATLDAVAEALIVHGMAANNDDDLEGYSVEEIRSLLAEADASGPAIEWDAEAVRAEVRRRYAERNRSS